MGNFWRYYSCLGFATRLDANGKFVKHSNHKSSDPKSGEFNSGFHVMNPHGIESVEASWKISKIVERFPSSHTWMIDFYGKISFLTAQWLNGLTSDVCSLCPETPHEGSPLKRHPGHKSAFWRTISLLKLMVFCAKWVHEKNPEILVS